MASPAPARTPRRKSIDVSLEPDDRVSLYAQGRRVPADLRRQAVQIPFVTYFQDPFVAKLDPEKAFDKESLANWEPGLHDGPTSSRFALVDFNGDTGKLQAPARWDQAEERYVDRDGKPLDETRKDDPEFHQVNVWVLLQQALALFESAEALGRRIPWAFEGNRLIVVPHAGFGENAFYDRQSKSLQFYYFGDEKSPVFTCLSTDIVSHEFGHALLDGVRPLLNESGSVETAAFHEFFGDLTALTMTLHNNSFRRLEAKETGGDFGKSDSFSRLAEEFGKGLDGRPYLRNFRNKSKMADMAGVTSHHKMSEVLAGAMYDLLMRLGEHYATPEEGKKPKSPRQIYWLAADRLRRLSIQPLDLLPPVEITFRDYALAVCRAQRLAEPLDPEGYFDMAIEVFLARGILSKDDAKELREPSYLLERFPLSVRHSIDDISRSRAAAYRFLDDNREDLLIPSNRDFFVADLYDAHKFGRQNLSLPRQIIVQYAWREEVRLIGEQFGKFNGQRTTMLCGGTLVFDDNGSVLSWAVKPGSLPYGGKRERTGKVKEQWEANIAEGKRRRQKLLDDIAAQVAAGRVGNIVASPRGLLGTMVPPILAEPGEDGSVRFQLAPHLHLSETEQTEAEETGDRQWQISC